MKLAAVVLALLLIISGVFVWKRNRPAYDMRQSLVFNSPMQQILDPSIKWRSCDFESASRKEQFPFTAKFALHVERVSPESFRVTAATYPRDTQGELSRNEFSVLLSEYFGKGNGVWLGTCHFAAIPKTMHVQMLFTSDARLAQATPVYMDDVAPNGPRLEAFRESR